MSEVGSEQQPLRVAIIGSGPAGFYTVSNFLKHKDIHVEMDMYERLPTPFGLVRAGVAPDHQKYKTVTRAYNKSADNPAFRFFGNVAYGEHFKLADLQQYYHQIIFCSGASSDRNLDVPGEDLTGSHSATDFVAWYNGHPDCVDFKFDLGQESAAIIGLGNVAVDVARILCKTNDELKNTDMADYAIAALADSNIKNVYILGRRGPAQAAFTPPEIKEMGELEDTDVSISLDEATVDAASLEEMEAKGDKNTAKNVKIIRTLAETQPQGKGKQLNIRFLVSPTEIIGDENGNVTGIKVVKNEAYKDEDGSVRARATAETETIPVGLVFRSVGYRGVPLPEIPFNAAWGTIFNDAGRITNSDGAVQPGLYTAGWIKRGPTGVIGTNKTDAQETVNNMVEDLKAGKFNQPDEPAKEAAEAFIQSRQADLISYQDWAKIDASEVEKGLAADRPRVKYTDVKSMLDLLER
ncbi:MAG: FAD-dependent oxidoreductase [Pseudomonadales bacterium]|nr:FAD-dependent oxidoreductase [Pseudomonadales bacterium]